MLRYTRKNVNVRSRLLLEREEAYRPIHVRANSRCGDCVCLDNFCWCFSLCLVLVWSDIASSFYLDLYSSI